MLTQISFSFMKKFIKIILIVAAIITASIIGLNFYRYQKKLAEIKNLPDYYQELAEQCLQKSSYGCCISSVRAMKDGDYRLNENNTCKDGFTLNMMKCVDSFKWCEPIRQ